MVMWCIWNERNGRIFKDRKKNVDEFWSILQGNLLSSILSSQWDEEDKIIPKEEHHVAKNWGIEKAQLDGFRSKVKLCRPVSPSLQSPPPTRVFKINFNGAARGNLGPAGYGCVCRDTNGKVLTIYLAAIGSDTNNSMELEGLIGGFKCLRDGG